MVWKVDPNVCYFGFNVYSEPKQLHLLLFLFSLLFLLLFWLPYTLLLLFYPCIQRINRNRLLRWTNKLKPFIDVHFGPFKDHHTYWVGILLLFRAAYLMLVCWCEASKILLFVTAIAVTVFLSVRCNGVYSKWYLTTLENSFLLNLVVVSVASIVYPNSKAIIFVVSTLIAFIQFLGIVLVHFVSEFRKSKVYLWLKTKCISHRRRAHVDTSPGPPEETRQRVVTHNSVYMNRSATLTRTL